MLLNVRIENFLVYSAGVDFSLLAGKSRKFGGSVAESAGFSVLKSACVYGGNNVGKSCAVRAIRALKSVMRGEDFPLTPNLFSDNRVVSLGISFTDGDKAYSFDFCYDTTIENNAPRGFIYQKLSEYGGKKPHEKLLYLLDKQGNEYSAKGLNAAVRKRAEKMLAAITTAKLAPFATDDKEFELFVRILSGFAKNTEFADMGNISLAKTIGILKENGKKAEVVREFLKQADLEIEDIYFDFDAPPINNFSDSNISLYRDLTPDDIAGLYAVRRGKRIQSYVYDSNGTKKIIAAASYIIEALTEGKTLVVDELDAGLHFKLTRAVVSLFNNCLNENAQLIFTTHDLSLLDCKNLFRKDQIWFAAKDENGEYLYSLADFDGFSDSPDRNALIKKYNEGLMGALPKPDLISVILKKEEGE